MSNACDSGVMGCRTWIERGDYCGTGCEDSCELYCQNGCETNCESTCMGCQRHERDCGNCEYTYERNCGANQCVSCQDIHQCGLCQNGQCDDCQISVQNSAPSNVTTITVSNGTPKKGETISLSWNPAYDRDGNFKDYVIYRSVNNGSYTSISSTTSTYYHDTVRDNWVSVRYYVVARDALGAMSDPVYTNYISVVQNQAPTISGSNLSLGDKNQDFNVEYLIQDADGDEVKVEIKVDGVTKQQPTVTTLGVKKSFKVNVKDYPLGKHTIEIIARDKNGAELKRVYTFNRVNQAPKISGLDEELGEKNTGFSYSYSVSDIEKDTVTIIERFNGKTIRSLENADTSKRYQINITDEMIKGLKLGSLNTIEIEAKDENGSSFRRIKFIKSNSAPVISDKDKDLGDVTNELKYKWSATDLENDKLKASVFLDDKLIQNITEVTPDKEYVVNVKGLQMLKLAKGTHTIKIVVEDENLLQATRTVTFNRVINRLVMKLGGKGIKTDEPANRILVSTAGIHVSRGAIVKYEVTNNSYADKPTWEDATNEILDNKAYKFSNKDFSADKAGIDIKITIEKGTSTNQSYITAIGGSFD